MFQMSGDGAKNTPVVEKPPNDYYCESIGAIGHCGKKAGFIFQFTMRTPPHCILGSTGWEEPVEFEFLGP